MKERVDKPGILTMMIVAGNVFVWIVNIAAGGGGIWGLILSGGGYVKEAWEATFQMIMAEREWWRLLTCGYIHMGGFHLLFNVYALLIVGSKMEKYLGHLKIFLFYHLGIIITALLWCFLFKNGSMAGASLGIFVVLGMYKTLGRLDKFRGDFQLSRAQKNYLIAYIVIGCFLGMGTIVVHLIGFIIGVLFGCLCVPQRHQHSLG